MTNELIADGVYRVSGMETSLKNGAWVSDAGTYLVTDQTKLADIPEARPGDIAFTAGYSHIWQLDVDSTTWVELPKTAAGTAATQAAASATAAAGSASAAAASASQAQTVAASIPADYTSLSNSVVDLKSAFIEEDSIPFTNDGDGYINALSRGEVISSSTFSHTDYINVEYYKTILYKISKHTIGDPSVGMVFYDETKTKIVGYPGLASQSVTGYYDGMNEVFVPASAKYARFSFYTDTDTYGAFKIIGTIKSKLELEVLKASGNLIGNSLKQGTVNITGCVVVSDKVIRTRFLPIKAGDNIIFKAGETNAKNIMVSLFDDSGAFNQDVSWRSSGAIQMPYDGYVTILFRRGDGEALSPDQYDASTIIQTAAATTAIKECSQSIEEIRQDVSELNHYEVVLSEKSDLFIGMPSTLMGNYYLNKSSANVSYLFEPKENTVYQVKRTGSSARFRIGGVNSLVVGPTEYESPAGKILYHNDAGTTAVFNSENWRYILIQCATSSSQTMPTVLIKTLPVEEIKYPVSLPSRHIYGDVSKFFAVWDDLFVTDGGASAKYGLNNVCYKETIATVHDVPLNAYLFSFGTMRMLNGASYNLTNEAPGEIAFGNYMEYGTKKKIMLTSGMHGDERATPSALMQWLYNLCYNPDYKKYQCFDYYVIPICNPTGYNANTRNNADGININRDAITKASAEAQAITEFISSQTYEMYFDFHQCFASWESTSLPYYGFVSQANNTQSDIMAKVNQYITKAIANTDYALNNNFEKTDNPQGGFLWEGSPESESPGTFRNFGLNYAPISCTFETSQRCPYYSGDTANWYTNPAMVCNQTFFDNVMAQMMDMLGA